MKNSGFAFWFNSHSFFENLSAMYFSIEVEWKWWVVIGMMCITVHRRLLRWHPISKTWIKYVELFTNKKDIKKSSLAMQLYICSFRNAKEKFAKRWKCFKATFLCLRDYPWLLHEKCNAGIPRIKIYRRVDIRMHTQNKQYLERFRSSAHISYSIFAFN